MYMIVCHNTQLITAEYFDLSFIECCIIRHDIHILLQNIYSYINNTLNNTTETNIYTCSTVYVTNALTKTI